MKRNIACLFAAFATYASADWINLWPGDAPAAKPRPVAGEINGEGGRLSDIAVPQYEVYLAEKSKANGAAAVIFPGGGYGMLASNFLFD